MWWVMRGPMGPSRLRRRQNVVRMWRECENVTMWWVIRGAMGPSRLRRRQNVVRMWRECENVTMWWVIRGALGPSRLARRRVVKCTLIFDSYLMPKATRSCAQ